MPGTIKSSLWLPSLKSDPPAIYHNSAVVIDADGNIVGKYRKMHIPDDPLYYEKFYFTPGDLGFPVFKRVTPGGALVCWDQWFPEAARLASLERCRNSFLSDGDWLDPQRSACGRAKSTRCLATDSALPRGGQRVFVAAVNRVGREGKSNSGVNLSLPVPSEKSSPGERSTRRDCLLAKCDLSKIEETRQNWPFLRDRRIDAYGAICNHVFSTDKS